MLMLRQNTILLIATGVLSGPNNLLCWKIAEYLHFNQPIWLTIGIHGILWGAILPLLFIVRDYCLRLAPVNASGAASAGG